MKKSILALTAAPLLLASSLSYAMNSQESTVTIKVDPIEPSCELYVETDEALLGERVYYSAASYNGTVPFIQVSSWAHYPDSINLNNSELERISYLKRRAVLAEPDKDSKLRKDWFALNKREHVSIRTDLKETQLGITLTCYDSRSRAKHELTKFIEAGGDEAIHQDNRHWGYDYKKQQIVEWDPSLTDENWNTYETTETDGRKSDFDA